MEGGGLRFFFCTLDVAAPLLPNMEGKSLALFSDGGAAVLLAIVLADAEAKDGADPDKDGKLSDVKSAWRLICLEGVVEERKLLYPPGVDDGTEETAVLFPPHDACC